MKKNFSKTITYVIVLALILSIAPFGTITAHASGNYWKEAGWWSSGEITSGNYVYRHQYISDDDHTKDSPNVTIVNYTGPGGHVTVPATLDGYPVDCIFVDAFGDHDDITEITISEGISSLGWSVFAGCDNLQKITFPSTMEVFSSGEFEGCNKLATAVVNGTDAKLKVIDGVIYKKGDQDTLIVYLPGKPGTSFTVPDGVSTIADDAFDSANRLKSITIPAGVTQIGDKDLSVGIRGGEVFNKCENLESINVDGSNPNYKSINGVLYSKDMTYLFRYPAGKPDSVYTIPDTITTVLVNAFINIRELTTVHIPASVSKFEIVGINGMLYNPFDGCDNLKEITLAPGSRYLSMRSGALYSKDGTDLIACPANLQGQNVSAATLQSIQSQNVSILSGRTGNYTVPVSADTIISRAFSGCKLATVTIPANVKHIADDAFKNTDGIIVCGYIGSAAEKYAADQGIPFVDITKGTLPAPGLNAYKSTYNSITLVWGEVAGANAYEVWRKDGGTYTRIAVTKERWYVNTGLKTGTTYTYRVRGYVNNTPRIYSNYSTTVSIKPVPAPPKTIKAASYAYNKIKVSWGKVAGFTKYEVWCATSSEGQYKLVGTTSSTSYIQSGVATGKTYYYKVRAYRKVNGKHINGGFSDIASAKATLGTPASLKAVRVSTTSIKISFKKVSGANKYEIWRALSDTGTFVLMKTTASTSFINQGLKTGQTYDYKVRAYRMDSGKKVYGVFSTVKSAKP